MKKFTDEQKLLIVDMYRRGESYAAIGRVVSCSRCTIGKYAREAGIPPRELGIRSKSPEERSRIARLGGEKLAQNKAHMSAIGKIGGSNVSKDRAHMATIGRRGGLAVSRDPAHMAQIGKIGGDTPRESKK